MTMTTWEKELGTVHVAGEEAHTVLMKGGKGRTKIECTCGLIANGPPQELATLASRHLSKVTKKAELARFKAQKVNPNARALQRRKHRDAPS